MFRHGILGIALFAVCTFTSIAHAETIGLGEWVVTDAGSIDSRYRYHLIKVARIQSQNVTVQDATGQNQTVTVRWVQTLDTVIADQKVDMANELVTVVCTDNPYVCAAQLEQ